MGQLPDKHQMVFSSVQEQLRLVFGCFLANLDLYGNFSLFGAKGKNESWCLYTKYSPNGVLKCSTIV